MWPYACHRRLLKHLEVFAVLATVLDVDEYVVRDNGNDLYKHPKHQHEMRVTSTLFLDQCLQEIANREHDGY